MLIILIDTFHHLSSSHPYTEPLKHYSVQISQPVSILFVIKCRGRIKYYSTQILELAYKTSENIVGIVLQSMLALSYLS